LEGLENKGEEHEGGAEKVYSGEHLREGEKREEKGERGGGRGSRPCDQESGRLLGGIGGLRERRHEGSRAG
jgi:hypothetical protein